MGVRVGDVEARVDSVAPTRPVMGGGWHRMAMVTVHARVTAHPRSLHGPVCSDARLALIHTWWASAMGIDSLLAFEPGGSSTIRQTPSSGI